MNLDDWPDDPFQIIGVAHNASERDVKRAYTRRIKIFKPEQYPLHFRRLRDAYEWICRHVLPNAPAASPDQIVLETASTLWEAAAAASETSNPAPAKSPAEHISPRDRWQQLTAEWRRAVGGDVGTAYTRLVAQQAQAPEAEVYVRLYWLLFAAPDLDANRTAIDWLADGIARHGFNGQLAALYLQELRRQPAEATSERCTQILAAQKQPGAILDLLTARWLAYDALSTEAEVRGRWADAIFDDVELVRPRLRLFDEQALTRTLMMAVEHLSWRPTLRGADLAKLLIDELNQTEFSPRDLFHQLDHMEGVIVQSGAWRRAHRAQPLQTLAPLVASILNAIRIGALQPSEETRGALDDCIQKIAAAPGEAVSALDFIEAKGGGVTILFANLLNVLRYENEYDRLLAPNEWLRERILNFIYTNQWTTGWTNYGRWRAALLDFCLQYCVSPRTVRELVADNPNLRRADGIHLADLIGADVPLDCVFEASRLFWA